MRPWLPHPQLLTPEQHTFWLSIHLRALQGDTTSAEDYFDHFSFGLQGVRTPNLLVRYTEELAKTPSPWQDDLEEFYSEERYWALEALYQELRSESSRTDQEILSDAVTCMGQAPLNPDDISDKLFIKEQAQLIRKATSRFKPKS